MRNRKEKNLKYFVMGLSLILGIGIPVIGYTEIGDVLRGATVFGKNCVICHGNNAKGDGVLAKSLPVHPANLTDCRLTAEDPVQVIEGIVREGGAYTGLSTIMPAWGEKLTPQEISDVAAYVQSLCTKKNWLKGTLNFTRPLITGKAFPEQEIIVGGKFGQGDIDTSQSGFAVEYRLDGLTNVEVSTNVTSIDDPTKSRKTGIGDTSISVKRVLSYGYDTPYLVAVGIKAQFPTGDKNRGLGAGGMVWQTSLRGGFRVGNVVTQIDTRVTIPEKASNTKAKARYNLALAYILQPDPRMEVAPIIELTNQVKLNGPNSGDTTRTLVPQLRFKWLMYSAGFGVQIPFENKSFKMRPLFDMTYEYMF